MFRSLFETSALVAVLIIFAACQAATSNTAKDPVTVSPAVAFQVDLRSDGSDSATLKTSFTPGSSSDSTFTATLVVSVQGTTVTIPVNGAWLGSQAFFQITGSGVVSATTTTYSASVSGFVTSGSATQVSASLVVGSSSGNDTNVYRQTSSMPTTVTSAAVTSATSGATASTAPDTPAVLADFVGAWASDSWTTFASADDTNGTSSPFQFRVALAADGSGQLDRNVAFDQAGTTITGGDAGDIKLVSIPAVSVGADDASTLFVSQTVVYAYYRYDSSGNPSTTPLYGSVKLKKKVTTAGSVAYKFNTNAVSYAATNTDFVDQASATAAKTKVGSTAAVRIPQATKTDASGVLVIPSADWTSKQESLHITSTQLVYTPASGSAQTWTVADKKASNPGIDGKGRPYIQQKFVVKDPTSSATPYQVWRLRFTYTGNATSGFATVDSLKTAQYFDKAGASSWSDVATAKAQATEKGTTVTYQVPQAVQVSASVSN